MLPGLMRGASADSGGRIIESPTSLTLTGALNLLTQREKVNILAYFGPIPAELPLGQVAEEATVPRLLDRVAGATATQWARQPSGAVWFQGQEAIPLGRVRILVFVPTRVLPFYRRSRSLCVREEKSTCRPFGSS